MRNTTGPTAQPATSLQEFGIQSQLSPTAPGRQLDLSFAARTSRRPACGRQQILRARAQHWFDVMRRVVDNAVEWKPTPAARPEQTTLVLAAAEVTRL